MGRSKSKKKRVLLYSGIALLCVVIFFVFEFIQIVKELPRPEKITSFQPVQSTKIYDRTGKVLLYEIHGEQNRTILADADIPLHAKQATIAIEDQGFYTHSAFDINGFIRAVFNNVLVLTHLKSGNIEGGSTITQQLVKQVFLTPERTLRRKIKELVLAYWMEGQYTKDEILDFYLNQIPYGSNAYGIESASNLYFGTSAKDLSIAQSAALAAIIQSPTYYSPWGKHVGEFLDRKDYVLAHMRDLGFITDSQYQSAVQEKLVFRPQSLGKIQAPHFVFSVKDYLVNTYGEDAVENGGLKVITTLDWDLQQIAEAAVKEGAEKNQKNYKGSNAALVAEDPKTGQILAHVGSADYFNEEIQGNFDVITQGLRQPGSTMKPIVYLTSFMKGYTPDTIVFDVKTQFNTNQDHRYDYSPENFEGTFRGPVTFKEALSQSINVPAVKVLYLTGMQNVLDTSKKLGITTLTDPSRYGLSLVLGGGEIRPIELLGAYGVFAQDGVRHTQTSILQVEDADGNVLERYKDEAEQVIDPQYIRMINSILSSAELRSGLFHASLPLTIFDGYQVALKTGTTNDYRDAWTIGYTPFLVAAVWAGNNNNDAMQQQGSSLLAALPMWSNFMREAIQKYGPETFPAPMPSLALSNPLLNGQYIVQTSSSTSPHVHTILYYADKDAPRDFSPPRTTDPQFLNWEIPVLTWARQHIPNFDATYNK